MPSKSLHTFHRLYLQTTKGKAYVETTCDGSPVFPSLSLTLVLNRLSRLREVLCRSSLKRQNGASVSFVRVVLVTHRLRMAANQFLPLLSVFTLQLVLNSV
jgi:hypothetical protein